MLEVNSIYKTFNPGTVNEKLALDGLSLKLNEGDFVTVIGGNGAGKSTLLNALAGVWYVDEGSIRIDGVDVTKVPENKRAAYLGRVFQDPMMGTAATMGIDENLALAMRRGKKRGLRAGITKKERDHFRELLKVLDLGLEDRLTSKVVLETTNNIIKKDNLTTLMITHNMRDAIANGNRLIMMNSGKIILDISGEEKKKLTVDDLLHKFAQVSGESMDNDRMLLS